VGKQGAVPRTTLPPHPTSPAAGRRFVADVLWQRGFATAVIDDAVLLTSEAVTNAVVHAGTPIDVVVTVDAAMARIEVHDGQPDLPVARDPAPDDASGRGLRVIEALAEAWGVQHSVDGTCLWFELRP
jgi:anti-sigma regulatory factor (Ser/Thr protein kinase)